MVTAQLAALRRAVRAPRLRTGSLIAGGAILLVAYLALVPLVYLVSGTFFDESGPTLRYFADAYADVGLLRMVGDSLAFAAGSTVLSMVVGTALAYLAVRTDMPLRRWCFAAALVPLAFPGILYTIAWVFLASPRIGLINRVVEPVLGRGAMDIFSLPGMILVEGLQLAPIVFLLMAASFRSMDTSLEESAVMSGARLMTTLRRVTLPLVRPAVLSGIVLMAVRSLEAFEVPAILGIPGGVWLFTSRIWRALDAFPPRFGVAGAYALSLLAITAVAVYLYSRLSGRGRAFETITGKGRRPHPIQLGRWRRPVAVVVAAYLIVAVVLPLAVLVYASTQSFYSVPTSASLARANLDNYAELLSSDLARRGAWNSLVLSVTAATAVMGAMAVIAWVIVRTRAPGRWLLDGLASLPLAVPGLVMGLSLLFVYLRVPLPIYGTLAILFVAYFTRYMPYGVRYAAGSMFQVGRELEESAHTSGADWLQTFRRILLPLVFPGLAAGWIYIVMVSLRELSSSILLYSPGNEVLSVVIWEEWENGQLTDLAALGVVMVAGLLVIVGVAYRMGARFGLGSA